MKGGEGVCKTRAYYERLGARRREGYARTARMFRAMWLRETSEKGRAELRAWVEEYAQKKGARDENFDARTFKDEVFGGM